MDKECCNINEVVREFYDYLKSFILKKTNDKNIAEDIVQEVMLKLVESHRKSTRVVNIKAWLFQVTRNTIADYYKKNNLVNIIDAIQQEDRIVFQDLPKVFESDFVIPMLSLLPDKFSTPLRLSDIENLPQKEIALELGLGLSATKMRIQRGRKKLQELFIECCHIKYDRSGNFLSCSIKEYCEPLKKIEKKQNS